MAGFDVDVAGKTYSVEAVNADDAWAKANQMHAQTQQAQPMQQMPAAAPAQPAPVQPDPAAKSCTRRYF